ncbi:MAG TPA: hypothetical protein VIL36_08645, partial [Acidimicrobiales bacterium]
MPGWRDGAARGTWERDHAHRSRPRGRPTSWEAGVMAAAQAAAYGDREAAAARVRQLADRAVRGDAGGLSDALGDQLVGAVAACWDRGWQPADLAHVVGRRLKSEHRRVLAEIVALEAVPYVYDPNADPAWLAQVDAVTPSTAPPDRHGLLAHWTAARGDTAAAIAVAVETLGLLWRLPTQPRLCPPPSAWGETPRSGRRRPAGAPWANGGRGAATGTDPK